MGELVAGVEGCLRPTCETWWTVVGLCSFFLGALGLLISALNPLSPLGCLCYLSFGSYVVLSTSPTLRATVSRILDEFIPQAYREICVSFLTFLSQLLAVSLQPPSSELFGKQAGNLPTSKQPLVTRALMASPPSLELVTFPRPLLPNHEAQLGKLLVKATDAGMQLAKRAAADALRAACKSLCEAGAYYAMGGDGSAFCVAVALGCQALMGAVISQCWQLGRLPAERLAQAQRLVLSTAAQLVVTCSQGVWCSAVLALCAYAALPGQSARTGTPPAGRGRAWGTRLLLRLKGRCFDHTRRRLARVLEGTASSTDLVLAAQELVNVLAWGLQTLPHNLAWIRVVVLARLVDR